MTWCKIKRKIPNTSPSLYLYSDVDGWKIIKGPKTPLRVDYNTLSSSTFRTEEFVKRVTHCNNVNVLGTYNSAMNLQMPITSLFSHSSYGSRDTFVYMTLSNNLYHKKSSATQATASINKCFQVYDWKNNMTSSTVSTSDYHSTCTMSTLSNRTNQDSEHIRYPRVYFFGRKKDEKKQKGMGPRDSHTKIHRTNQTTNTATKTCDSKTSLQCCSNSNMKTSCMTTKRSLPSKASKTAATSVGSTKTVTIKEEKPQKPCPALATTKGDMMVTVSHIKIGPKESCPVHGNEPCQGPKCVLASSGQEQAPVKITSVNNPRRGVFEVVVRRLTGAPLAKNELMLEWTPPPSRPAPCGIPCPSNCFAPGTYRPSRCKLVICRPSPCQPKCSKKKRCVRPPCRKPCNKCCKPMCAKTCFPPCRPCSPPRCSRCTPSICGSCSPPPCSPPPCFNPPCSPCKSSPCLRPCPVGYKRPRKYRSQPKIKSHKKRKSPCANSSQACPIVKCRSIAGPCIACCTIPPICFPRKSCSTLPCKPLKCMSSCSSCCG